MKPQDKDPSSYVTLQDELYDFLNKQEKEKIEEKLYPEEKPFYFRDIPEGESDGDLVKNNNKNNSQFFAKYFKSMN